MHHEWPAHDVDWFDPSIVIWSCQQRLLFWRGLSRASPFGLTIWPHHLAGFIWLHFASFGFGWADSVHEAKQCQEAQEDFLQTITVWSLDSEAFLYGEDDAEWCRMMLNEHEWTKQSRSNLRVQLVEADLNSTNLFGNSDDDNLLAGEPFPLRYWHYDWHECECHSAVRQSRRRFAPARGPRFLPLGLETET